MGFPLVEAPFAKLPLPLDAMAPWMDAFLVLSLP
jgi:hypothetical protein